MEAKVRLADSGETRVTIEITATLSGWKSLKAVIQHFQDSGGSLPNMAWKLNEALRNAINGFEEHITIVQKESSRG